MDAEYPGIRFLGLDGESIGNLESSFAKVGFHDALELANSGDIRWLRAAANVLSDESTDVLSTLLERALGGGLKQQREGALAAIETGERSVLDTLRTHLDLLQDPHLVSVVREALG
ncbi:MAG TPA: hypothetical protein ENJ50_03745 [Planctomycetaceae bacterium]|nr:hypothetical protein [Planctomycetaceae bacterium]